MQEVSEFIVVPPYGLDEAVARCEQRLIGHLTGRFPHYSFRVLNEGPSKDREEFTIVPIMNRRPRPEERTDRDRIFMCRPLDPRVIPQIREVLREFRFEPAAAI